MSDRRADIEMLRAFAREGDQQAFAAVARRHLDLVYATALRKIDDPGAAEEVAQNVFAALGRKAWQFAPDDSLPAWLHRTTLLESKAWLRGELRRRRREQTAAELGTTMNAPDEEPAVRALVPLVDEALLSLREEDRTALLLRYYESQSLRDVGLALEVNEDAARKRVGSALEKMVRFFHRRGFKTATTTAIAGVLKHTAASASTATAIAVVEAALQWAPPTLTGLSLLMARLAGLTKMQTAGLCLLLTAAPLGWKWNEAQAARAEISGIQLRSDVAGAQTLALSAEIARLRARAIRLDAAMADAVQTRAQNEETARKLELLKSRIRGLLTDPNYQWPEDLPFVRVPKAALSSMNVPYPVAPPGIVKPEEREVLGLTPEERQRVENALAGYFAVLNERIHSSLYETNRPARRRTPEDALASKVFVVPALGKDVSDAAKQLISDLQASLGNERWGLLKPAFESDGGSHSIRRIMNLDAVERAQEIMVWIKQEENGQPAVYYLWNSGTTGFGRDGVALSEFVPERIHDTVAYLDLLTLIPDALLNRITTWLGEEAVKRLPDSSRP